MGLRTRDVAVRFARSGPAVFTAVGPALERVGPAERRRHPRHAMATHCWVDAERLTVLGPIQDIGVGGLFVRTAVPLSNGDLVELSLRVGGELDALTARAIVARVVPVRPGYCHGIGLEFVQIHHGQRVLRGLLDGALTWAESRLG